MRRNGVFEHWDPWGPCRGVDYRGWRYEEWDSDSPEHPCVVEKRHGDRLGGVFMGSKAVWVPDSEVIDACGLFGFRWGGERGVQGSFPSGVRHFSYVVVFGGGAGPASLEVSPQYK